MGAIQKATPNLAQTYALQGEDVLAAYLADLDVKPRSRKAYGQGVRHFLEWTQERGIPNPTRADLIAYKEETSRTYTAATARLYIQSVKGFYKWLEAHGITEDVAQGLKLPKKPEGFRKEALTPEQASAVIRSLPLEDTEEASRNRAIVLTLLLTGTRLIELQRADLADLQEGGGGEGVLLIQGKGREEKDERALLPPHAMGALKAYLDKRGELEPSAPLFASCSDRNHGGRLTTRTLSSIAKKALQEAGLDSELYTAHSFRHTAATLALLGGATLQEVQAMTRHADINTTLIYAHNVERMRNAPERKIEAVLEWQ